MIDNPYKLVTKFSELSNREYIKAQETNLQHHAFSEGIAARDKWWIEQIDREIQDTRNTCGYSDVELECGYCVCYPGCSIYQLQQLKKDVEVKSDREKIKRTE